MADSLFLGQRFLPRKQSFRSLYSLYRTASLLTRSPYSPAMVSTVFCPARSLYMQVSLQVHQCLFQVVYGVHDKVVARLVYTNGPVA